MLTGQGEPITTRQTINSTDQWVTTGRLKRGQYSPPQTDDTVSDHPDRHISQILHSVHR
jgi:hypothetical protein